MADMLSQLKDPEAFVQRVREIYTTPRASSFDILEFKDGALWNDIHNRSGSTKFQSPRLELSRCFRAQRLEEQLRQSQKMEAIGQLAGGIAHDFNNLLTVINGYCDLLLGNLTDCWQESVREIREAGRRAGQLTEQLLTFSRQSRFQSQIVSLNCVIGSSEKLLRRLIGEQISLSVILDPNVGAIRQISINSSKS